MIKKQYSTLFTIFCGILLATTSFATEAAANNGHALVGTRAESIESRMARFVSEADMTVLMKKEVKSAGKSFKAENQNISSLARGVISFTAHSDVYQNPVSISFNTVELMDGSIWEISPSDVDVIAYWVPTDLVYITPNHSRFTPYFLRSPYVFRLTNVVTGNSVPVNLKYGPIDPIYNSIYSRWIKAIDYYYNLVYLDDGSVWNTSSWDSNVVQQWIAGDVVMIGVNDDWMFSYSKYVLINVATLNYAVAEIVTSF